MTSRFKGPFSLEEIILLPNMDESVLVCPEKKSPKRHKNWILLGSVPEFQERVLARRAEGPTLQAREAARELQPATAKSKEFDPSLLIAKNRRNNLTLRELMISLGILTFCLCCIVTVGVYRKKKLNSNQASTGAPGLKEEPWTQPVHDIAMVCGIEDETKFSPGVTLGDGDYRIHVEAEGEAETAIFAYDQEEAVLTPLNDAAKNILSLKSKCKL